MTRGRRNFLAYVLTIVVVVPTPVYSRECNRSPTDPIIDAHVHTFNLRHLPMAGIIKSRGVPRLLADLLADAFIHATGSYGDGAAGLLAGGEVEPEEISEQSIFTNIKSRLNRRSDFAQVRSNENEIDNYLKSLSDNKASFDIALARAGDPEQKMLNFLNYAQTNIVPKVAPEMALDPAARSTGAAVQLANIPVELKAIAIVVGSMDGPREPSGVLYFLYLLMMSPEALADRALDVDLCESSTIISVMMDMEHVYDDKPTVAYRDQHQIWAEIQQRRGDRFQFLTAFDPFRKDPDFTVVNDGMQRGATGVKFYPPSGYRPGETVITPSQCGWFWPLSFFFCSAKHAQWQSRYGDLDSYTVRARWRDKLFDEQNQPVDPDAISDARFLDLINLAFFRFAVARDIAVFSHHTNQGFEAVAGYGKTYANPRYWDRILRVPGLEKLRLLLAHSGGDGWYLSEADWNASFAKQAYQLCVTYQNVYCDFGFHDQVTSAAGWLALRERLLAMFDAEQSTPPNSSLSIGDLARIDYRIQHAPTRYSIFRKIIYGTDWTMVARLKNRDFVNSFRTVFEHPKLVQYRSSFFATNAREAFKLE